MSHFLRTAETGRRLFLNQPHIGMSVEITKHRPRVLTVGAGLPRIVKTCPALVPLPDDVVVKSQSGEVIEPTWAFYISTETFNPFHLLLDVRDEALT